MVSNASGSRQARGSTNWAFRGSISGSTQAWRWASNESQQIGPAIEPENGPDTQPDFVRNVVPEIIPNGECAEQRNKFVPREDAPPDDEFASLVIPHLFLTVVLGFFF